MEKDKASYYLVTGDVGAAPLADHLWHGFEEKTDFVHALRQLADRWRGRVGECVGERHGFLLLRFHDTPGGLPDEEWLPRYLLRATEAPPEPDVQDSDGASGEIDRAFGFD